MYSELAAAAVLLALGYHGRSWQTMVPKSEAALRLFRHPALFTYYYYGPLLIISFSYFIQMKYW